MPKGSYRAACGPTTIVIGAAGAVGKRLCNALAARGSRVCASDRMPRLPSTIRDVAHSCVGGVDVRDPVSLKALFREHANEQTVVWNLASPLSVETAMDPAVAEAVTIGGMRNVLEAMKTVGARRICFTDSIGSFGASSPRDGASARWLVEHPEQDPGSDYGRQKRGCRELMSEFAHFDNGDPRFAVLPGVLHSEPIWGNGTTEYALDALLAAARGEPFVCPVETDVLLPMVFVDDLMRGLLALQDADEGQLGEPQNGYCIPGFSFTASELFDEVRKHVPDFEVSMGLNENMSKFAKLWPDTLATAEPKNDLGYEPRFGLADVVEGVLDSHKQRRFRASRTFKAFSEVEKNESGRYEGFMRREEVEKLMRRQMVGGREKHGWMIRRQDIVTELLDKAMKTMDENGDGKVSLEEFKRWTRRHSIDSMVEEYMAERTAAASTVSFTTKDSSDAP